MILRSAGAGAGLDRPLPPARQAEPELDDVAVAERVCQPGRRRGRQGSASALAAVALI